MVGLESFSAEKRFDVGIWYVVRPKLLDKISDDE